MSYIGIKFFEIAYFLAKICVDIWIPEFWFAYILQSGHAFEIICFLLDYLIYFTIVNSDIAQV